VLLLEQVLREAEADAARASKLIETPVKDMVKEEALYILINSSAISSSKIVK